ncbi:MAG: type III pantothenate kinase [Rhodanobacteraceae bacterium]
MQLLIDLGNTRLKWSALAPGVAPQLGAFAHADMERGDLDVSALLDREWSALPRVQQIYAASVAPPDLDREIDAFVRRRFGIGAQFLQSPAHALGIRNAYAEPHRLGIDRFLALAALHAEKARAQVLIGVGTAMTLDAIDRDGVHLGGWILPSPELMRQSVLARTARVGVADGARVEFADNSADALRSGSLFAASGAVERFCANAARRFNEWPAVVLTGGGADEIAPLMPGVECHSDLVLQGLALWASAGQSPEIARGTQ